MKMNEEATFAVYQKKLKGICEENDLQATFNRSGYPLTMTVRPLLMPENTPTGTRRAATASLSTANAPKKTSRPRRPRSSLHGRPKPKNTARNAASLRRTKNPPTVCG